MYTFCSFYQEIKKYRENKAYLSVLIERLPIWLASSNCETIKSLSALEKAILASKRRLLDCTTSNVVLVFPESYSSEIPSFAISAAFSCALDGNLRELRSVSKELLLQSL